VGPNFLPVIIARFAREQLEFPKPLTDEVLRAADVVVTLGCGDVCPVYPGRRYLDWPVADPAGRSLEAVRRIRYEIYYRVWDLLETLVPTDALIAIHGPAGERG
jgi:protein-tyrosine-phosphatase